MKTRHKLFGLLCALGMLFSAQAVADNHDQEMLAEFWVMIPKEGASQDVQQALIDHIAHRKTLGDPRQWHIYRPVLGDKLSRVIVRACCFTWADQDAYEKWNQDKNPIKHWNDTGSKSVAGYEHYLSVQDMENSHWPKETKASFVGVNNLKVKAGHWQAMMADLKAISDIAKKNNWPHNWAWSYSVSGTPGITLAFPYENYAAMAPPEEKFAAFLAKHMGGEDKAKALLESWRSHFESSHYNVYRHVDTAK